MGKLSKAPNVYNSTLRVIMPLVLEFKIKSNVEDQFNNFLFFGFYSLAMKIFGQFLHNNCCIAKCDYLKRRKEKFVKFTLCKKKWLINN